MQEEKFRELARSALAAVPGPSASARRWRGLLYFLSAVASVGAAAFVDERLGPSGGARGILWVLAFAGYAVFGWRVCALWFPGLDNAWRKRRFSR